ncbi:MAG: type II toxin-antitoxin system HicB family antitoxin [Rubrivivax sp.]|nr:type II toxin-antitoxin system HicB family antitoxin [Rubrivivax sp.]
MRHAVVIERAEHKGSAYVPDLPGRVVTGATVAGVEAEIREAVAFHVEGLHDDSLPVAVVSSQVEYVDVVAQLASGSHRQAAGSPGRHWSREYL